MNYLHSFAIARDEILPYWYIDVAAHYPAPQTHAMEAHACQTDHIYAIEAEC
jgi:hypothetical protein